MSTRSGKRIHSSFHENIVTTDPELALKSERKTRSKRLKENDDLLCTNISKVKKRHNYVSYPAEDEPIGDVISDATEAKNERKKHRNTLKDHNITVSAVDAVEPLENIKKAVRSTRRTKHAENVEENNVVTEVQIPNGTLGNEKKGKKSKKKKKKSSSSNENELQNGNVEAPAKKSKKKKKQKKSNSLNDAEKNNEMNKSGMSMDSFHSAAGSPVKENEGVVQREEAYIPIEKSLETNSQKLDENYEKKIVIVPLINNTFDKEIKKRNSSIKVDSKFYETIDTNASTKISPLLNGTFDKEPKFKRKSSIKNATFDKNENISLLSTLGPNSTFDKTELNTEKLDSTFTSNLRLNSTFDKTESNRESTVEVESSRKSLRLNSAKKDKTESKPTSLNSTFDKDTKILNSTFDKSETQNKTGSLKSSLTSSEDGTINVTFDKSDENIRISITSDDSTGNIVNTTPVHIESSMEESRISQSPQQTIEKDSVSETVKQMLPPPTPLKREGTFTKDGPDPIIMSPKPKVSTEKTPMKSDPTKLMSQPSPGTTPFPTRSSQKSFLNVTRSIEKSRKSSLVEVVPRQTKVMFCSPVNNPTLVMQQKKTVIKSSLKGSTKSFLFDDSVTTATKPGRKRSYTHNDAEDTRIKRKRLASDMQESVDRLSRPRTTSATANLDITTPQKKPATPYKQKTEPKTSRTKLPNFAALHRKEFDKMESLDECQERRAKRAKRLLTPTGAVGSPRVSKPKEPAKKNETPTKPKPEAVFKPKLLTLESLQPGYTRFGFKMNTDVNPFSVPSKVEIKPKVIKLNGIRKPLPSSAGATSGRKEVAKNTVLREKSFTSLSGKREEKRMENRTVIKGVRTNRRFHLQMRARNMN